MKMCCGVVLLCFLFSLRSSALDWYRWRGPDLNGISKETGWATAWQKEGPKQLWKASVGLGFSSMVVSQGRIYTLGNNDDRDTVYCFDAASGQEVWKHSYHEPLDAHYYEGGTSSTPTVDGDTVFTISRKGNLFSFEASGGKVRWIKNIAKEFDLTVPEWGFAGSPFIHGELLILNAGTHGIALKKKTGEIAWSTGKDACGYSTPLPFTSHETKALAIFGSNTIAAVEIENGKVVWTFPWKTQYDINAADPIISGDKMFISSGYRTGGALLKFNGEPTVLWKSQNMHNQLNACVLINGYLYGPSGQSGYTGDLRCVDFNTGDVKWKETSAGLGALMAADGKLIVLSEKGELIIAEATPNAFKPLARAQVLGGKCWTTPVISNGRIYCRNSQGNLVCVDVSGKQVATLH
ncbi:MAG TPA: PQQ-binding-like beta-propeller repeat protein [Candidatus Binatia bacterium]|nr:PQQ-binding-like beta-propeller repeat protein [Candidatus Binatia bacterium]